MNTFSEQEIEKLCKPFVILFAFSFLIINWTDVSWIFNYRVVSGFALEMFQTAGAKDGNGVEGVATEEVAVAEDKDSFTDLARTNDAKENKSSENKIVEPKSEPAKPQYTERRNSIKIPKIGISAPLIFVSNSNNQYLHDKLDSGVVHYPGSAKPGENGETIVLGHSAPPNWPKIKYDWVFSRLNELSKGDQIILYYNNQKYVYSVTRKVFLNKGQEMPKNDLTNNNNTLISISCWPPGKDYKRIAVESILVD
jgi:LPXTG-site transpeptidase (sortase) family protein